MSKKSTLNNYKVVCEDLDLVIFLRGLGLEEEKKLYLKVRAKVEKAKAPISVESYKEFVVETFLIDSKNFLESIKNKEDKDSVIESVYVAVIEMYPPFSLEFICNDLNTDNFFKGIDATLFKEYVSQGAKEGFRGSIGVREQGHIQLSSLGDLENLESFLKENLVGQDVAVESVTKALRLLASGLCKNYSFFFVGPTGVGKTQISRLLGERYSGQFLKINCAEYASQHEYAKLIGAPPGYVGHSDKSLLGEKAEVSNRWVILFDEIEKAHSKLRDFLLSLLDDGTVTDNLGNVLDFSESIFIFTSNQGTSEIKRDTVGFDRDSHSVSKEVTDEIISKSIKRDFSPEFLNRLDDTVYFNSLSRSDVKQIAALELDKIPILQTEPLLDYVVDNAYCDEYGARNICRFIKNNITTKVADAILNKRVPKEAGALYKPRLSEGEVKIVGTKKFTASST